MASTARGQFLHNRSTRGLPLSAEEQIELQAWYDELDEAESKILNASKKSVDLEALRALVKAADEQLLIAVKRLHEIERENERLRLVNDSLRELLSHQSPTV